MKNLIVATAGHVDHGKSALVKALTGTDPDRLPEEKARRITIDLGFAHLRLRNAAGAVFNLGLIDVPGHEDFVKNMVAGVGAIDVALLVVAADDGWMPQTEEHLHILDYLEARRGVVVITKRDRVDPARVAHVAEEARTRIGATGLRGAPIVSTSVTTGEGLPELRNCLLRVCADAPAARDIGRPRLWVDRAFTLRGVGTVVTGTLLGGTLQPQATLVVAGRPGQLRVRGIQNHGAAQSIALPGTRSALNVVAAGDAGAALEPRRGDLLNGPELHAVSPCCDVVLRRAATSLGQSVRLRHGTEMRFHVGTAAVPCRIVFADQGELMPGEQRVAQLRLGVPLSLCVGDHFVLRDAAGRHTVAGGRVLEPLAEARAFRRPPHQRFLATLANAPLSPDRYVRAQIERDVFVASATLADRTPFSADEIRAAVARLGHAVADYSGLLATTATWTERIAWSARRVREHHATHPNQNGMPVAQLKAALRRDGVPRAAVDILVQRLADAGFETVGAAIRDRCFRPMVPEDAVDVVAQLRHTLRRAGLNAPGRHDLEAKPGMRAALAFLLKTGEAVALGSDVVIAVDAFAAATTRVRTHLEAHGGATVSELKQLLGTTRRVMVPLIEKLDHEGITTRDGDVRRLRRQAGLAEATPPTRLL